MARPQKEAYDLSDAEKRDLVQLIQQGKPLPEKYRFILFEDKREVELVWNGKSREVCTTVLPFQSLEHIDEPRAETTSQEDLFDSRGRQQKGWTNKLIWGDNKLILSSLKAGALRQQIEDAGGLDRESLAALPGIQETLTRYREAGVEEKLRSQALIIKAEGVVTAAREAILPFASQAESVEALMPIAQEFLSSESLEGLPARAALTSLRGTISTFEAAAKSTAAAMRGQIETAGKAIEAVATNVAAEKTNAQAEYEQTLRDLQKAKIDGNEFIQLIETCGNDLQLV